MIAENNPNKLMYSSISVLTGLQIYCKFPKYLKNYEKFSIVCVRDIIKHSLIFYFISPLSHPRI